MMNDQKLYDESGFDIIELDFDVSAFQNEKSDRADKEIDNIIKQTDKITGKKCKERPSIYIGANENILAQRDNRVIVYLEEVIQETDNYIEVSNPNDRCRIFAKPKEAVFLNPDSKFQSYSNRGLGTIKCLIMKYDL